MISGQLNAGIVLQGRYRVLGRLGKGGMGVVYVAEDMRLSGRQWAVKELSPLLLPPAERAGAISGFQREAHVLARLSHPGLAKVADVFDQDGNWYLVMEYIAGQTLEDMLRTVPGGRLPVEHALNVVSQICDVLTYLHSQQPPIIFRDLKPSNIILPTQGGVKLIDFGIARFFKPGQTQDTQAMGTPGYAAPEQYGTGQSDARTDIFALGVVLHEMLTGYDPAITPFRLPPAESLNPTVPLAVGMAIRQATEHDPDLRPPTAAHFRQALFVPPPVDKGRRGKGAAAGLPRWAWALVGGGGLLVLIACLGIGVALLRRPSDAAPPSTGTAPVVVKASVTVEPVNPGGGAAKDASPTPSQTPAPPTAAPTVEPTETPTASPLPTGTSPPTSTPTETPTPTTTPSATPACAVAMGGPFVSLWEQYRDRLGCPLQSAPQQIWTAEQPFENGHMFWREDWDDFYIVYDGRGDVYGGELLWDDEPWSDGMPADSCTDQPPPGLIRPIRGFGLLWCTKLGASNARIGWALINEQGFVSSWHDFEQGSIFVDSDGVNRELAYIFFYQESMFVRQPF